MIFFYNLSYRKNKEKLTTTVTYLSPNTIFNSKLYRKHFLNNMKITNKPQPVRQNQTLYSTTTKIPIENGRFSKNFLRLSSVWQLIHQITYKRTNIKRDNANFESIPGGFTVPGRLSLIGNF